VRGGGAGSRWWGAAALSLVAALVVGRALLFDLRVLDSDTMAPGLQAGDLLLVGRRARIDVGDVVVLRIGSDPERYVKRVVALAGSQVELSAGRVFVDGQALDVEDRAAVPFTWRCGAQTAPGRVEVAGARRWQVVASRDDRSVETVPTGSAWVLGDQRARSRDSRTWGPVPLDEIDGEVLAVLWHSRRCGPAGGGA